MGESVLKSVKHKVSTVKHRGTTPSEKVHAYQSLLQSLLDKNVTRYHKFGSAIASYLKERKITKSNQSRPEWWTPVKRKPRKYKLGQDVRSSIREFVLSPSISREKPSKKEVLNESGELVQRHVMNMTLSEAFVHYKIENQETKVGFSSFKKEKPKQVKIVNEIYHRSCLCQICCNLALKIGSLKKHAEESKNTELLSKLKDINKTKVSNMTICDFEDDPNANCLNRSCTDCAPVKFTEYIQENVQENSNIVWYKWEYIQVSDEKTGGSKRLHRVYRK